MKNFSTVGVRLALGACCAGLAAAAAGAEDAVAALRWSPRARVAAPDGAEPASLSAHAVAPFASRRTILEPDALRAAPRIVAIGDGRFFASEGGDVYVRGAIGAATAFHVYRPLQPRRDAPGREGAGHEAAYLGTLRLRAAASPGSPAHRFTVAGAAEEITVGDYLLPAAAAPSADYPLHAPPRALVARVLAFHGGGELAGQHQVLTLDRGALDGLAPGAMFALRHPGRPGAVPSTDNAAGEAADDAGDAEGDAAGDAAGGRARAFEARPISPEGQFGSVLIVRVFQRIAYGLILQVTRPVEPGDLLVGAE